MTNPAWKSIADAAPILADVLDGSEVSVSRLKGAVRRSELDAVANRKLLEDLVVDADSDQTPWIVNDSLTRRFFD
jgi:rhodanese-related sulfurtransferase